MNRLGIIAISALLVSSLTACEGKAEKKAEAQAQTAAEQSQTNAQQSQTNTEQSQTNAEQQKQTPAAEQTAPADKAAGAETTQPLQ